MSLRKLADSLSLREKRQRGASASSTASWSPSNSVSHTPLASSVSLPDSVLDSNQKRYPSPTNSFHSSYSGNRGFDLNSTPLRIVAPFAYNQPPQNYESSSTLSSTSSKGSDSTTVRLKRSLTRMLATSSSDDQSHQYHYQKQSQQSQPHPEKKKSRKGSSDTESVGSSRTNSMFGGSSFFEEHNNSSTRASTSSTKKLVSWIGQKQSGVTKKVQEVLRSGGPSSIQSSMSLAKARVSGEFHDEEDDKSSISSAPSFVQPLPEDDLSRILSESDNGAALPMTSYQTPYQIPAAVYLPRSHTNLHALTLTSLAFPPSPHPLLYNPSVSAFPRSSNPSSKLPRLPTFRAHVAKTRILDRLEAQDLTQPENDSIVPFGRRDDFTQKEPAPHQPSEGESEEGRKINDQPGRSVGLEAWTRRPAFLQRAFLLQSESGGSWGEDIKYETPTPSGRARTILKFSPGIQALAGLVAERNAPPPDKLIESPSPDKFLSLPPVESSKLSFSSISVESFDEPIPMAPTEVSMPPTPITSSLIAPAHSPAPVASPRPLPRPPGPVDPSTLNAQQQLLQYQWQPQEGDDDSVPMPSVRPLPPRPLPAPPQVTQATPPPPITVPITSPKVTVDELESIEGPLLVANASFDAPSSAHLLSPPGSINGHGHAVQLHTSSTITSAPLTPLDPLETESLRRLSIGSMSVVIPGTSGLTLEEMDGLESANPLEMDHRRRSVVSLKMSVHKRLSVVSRASRGSSPSLRNVALPTLSESSQYSESSHLSSRHTPTGSAATSNERLNRQTHPSISSVSFDGVHEFTEQSVHDPELASSIGVEEPAASVIGDSHVEAFEPSRTSEEHIDPFIVPQLSNGSQQKLAFEVPGRSSPILSPAQSQQLLGSNHHSLSLSTDLPTPTVQKSEQKSPLLPTSGSTGGSNGRPSPSGSAAVSPTGSESVYSADHDQTRASYSSTAPPIKFIKLKRSGSQMKAENLSNGGLGSGGGKSMHRVFKDPGRYWPSARPVDEKEEEEAKEAIMDTISIKLSNGSVKGDGESISASSGKGHSASQSRTSIPRVEDSVRGDVPAVSTPLSATFSSSIPGEAQGNVDESIASLPLEIALDVARLSHTSNLDLSLFNPRQSPPPTQRELARSSLTSARSQSDSESAPRASSVKDIASNMAILPSTPVARLGAFAKHGRTPSSERAARIEAHLDSVGLRTRAGSQTRPAFLPFPGYNRPGYPDRNIRQPSEDDRTPVQGSFDRASQAGESTDDDSSSQQETPASARSYNPYAHPVSRPPARWSEATWRDRQRSLNTLPLPSASISHSATRAGINTSTMGRSVSSTTPSIFRPPQTQPGSVQGRSLRM